MQAPLINKVVAPSESPHNCTVHSCVWERNHPFKATGHLQPMGLQGGIANISVLPCDLGKVSAKQTSRAFWADHLAVKRPALVRGCPRVADEWFDDAKLEAAGKSWKVIVELQNRITSTHRHPFYVDWVFSKYISKYMKREYHNKLYMITEIPEHSLMHSWIPSEPLLACPEMAHSRVDARLWMSSGNTTSSLHFDTHDVLNTQIDGVKTWYLYDPNYVNATYMEYAARYGLSPINTDRVDLIRFPAFSRANAVRVEMRPGDRLILPALWWHVVHTHPGRNLMVTHELEYKINIGMPGFTMSSAFWNSVAVQKEKRVRHIRCTSADIDAHAGWRSPDFDPAA
mgnify:FL=1